MQSKSKLCLLALCSLHSLFLLDWSPVPAPDISKMSFLAGSWQGEVMGGEFHAYYSTPEGGKVLSYSELHQEGTVVFHEFERFELREDKIIFTPFPGGKPATDLVMTEIDADEKRVVFENPDKDFPTMIAYQRVADDRLVVTLSDPHKGSEKKQIYDLKRKD